MLSPLNQMILIALAVVTCAYGAYRALHHWRIRRASRGGTPTSPGRAIVATPPASRSEQVSAEQLSVPVASTDDSDGDYAFGGITPILAAMLPESEERKQRNIETLRQAGHYEAHAWHNLAAFRYLAMMLPIVGGLLLLQVAPPQLEPWVLAALVALPMLGWSLPTLFVRGRAAERLLEIEHAMPDVLDMMNMCVSQGMTAPAALARVGRELEAVSPPLSRELAIVVDQARVGSFEQALSNFGTRIDLPEVRSFTNLLVQTEKLGTSMSDSLAEYSDSMRESLRQQTDQRANTAAFKLLFPTVLCLMPAVFMILLGPATVELSTFFNDGGRDILDVSVQSANDVLAQ